MSEEEGGTLATLRSLWKERSEETEGRELLGRAAELVGRSVEQLRRYADVVRFLRPSSHDQIVAAGESFEVVAETSALRGLLSDRIRFSLTSGEEVVQVGEAEVLGGAAFFTTRHDTPGHYVCTWEALGPAGVVVQRGGSTRVHIVGDEPVVYVDAALAMSGINTETLSVRLGALARVASLVWVDFAEASRLEVIQQSIAALNLPPSIVLSHVHEGIDRSAYGASFHAAFLRTTCRRSRASGVAIVGLITHQLHQFEGCEGEGVVLLAPEMLASLGEEAGESPVKTALVAQLRAAAEEIHARRRRVGPFRFRLDETTRTPVRPGNRCHVEFDNRRAREAVVRSIDEASTSVDMQVYIVEDGALMDRFSAALIGAARRGVKVRVLVDALYSRDKALGMKNPILQALRDEPNVEVRAADPIPATDLFELQSLKKRDHRKVFVFDQRVAFVSGRNAGDLYYRGFDEVAITSATPYERIPWLDAHIEVTGPLVQDVWQSFEDAWQTNAGANDADPEDVIFSGPTAEVGNAHTRLVVHAAVDDANGMAAYEAILDGAEDHVYIVNDFPIVSTLVAAVRRALGRGVRVCLLTGNALPRRGDGTFVRGPLYREVFEHMTKGRLEPLVRRGLELYEYTVEPHHPLIVCAGGVVRPYVHAKLMSADGKVVSVGSANLDATASFWEREANVVVEDEASTRIVEAWIEAAFERSWRIDPESEYWTAEMRVREVVARLWPETVYS